MRVAVAGATGFIGRAVVDALRARGDEVLAIARHPRGNTEGRGDFIALDLGLERPPVGTLAGCDALVNLVGIPRPRGNNDFRRAHIDAVRHLVEAAQADGVPRFVHVSVVEVAGSHHPYVTSKREGEDIARTFGEGLTILRPALVVGPGDDALRRLGSLVRASPWVPVPAGARGRLQPVHVDDLAAAVLAAIDRTDATPRTIDIVGPDTTDLPGLVARVGRALGLRTRTLPIPDALVNAAIRIGTALRLPLPFSAAQLELLRRGLSGDATHAPAALGVTPRTIDDARIRAATPERSGPWTPSLRIVPDSAGTTDLASAAPWAGRALALALVLMLPMWLLPRVWPDPWTRMAAIEAVAAVIAVRWIPLPWRRYAQLHPSALALGLAAAGVLLLGTLLVLPIAQTHVPGLRAQVEILQGWAAWHPPGTTAALLAVVVVAEDIVWRIAILFPLAGRLGPLPACIAGGFLFAAAHVCSGPPVLWAAAWCFGACFSAVALRTRNLPATIACHLGWDAAMLLSWM